MNKIIEPEKTELRLKLMNKINKFIEEVGVQENNIGWIPDNLVETMTDAAFAVLMTVHGTNISMDENGLLKE